AVELIEGIENMQILYGEDTDADNTANYYVPAGTGGLNMNQVVSIRISLLVRSMDDNLTSEPELITIMVQTPRPPIGA
ncbi:MAG: PilW family protein, partial [Gammaproteobacteria bacterium]|nr:PilW family protein [Gammaproteobacteria bacterium]